MQTNWQRYNPAIADLSLRRCFMMFNRLKDPQQKMALKRLIADYVGFKVDIAFKEGRVTYRKIGMVDPGTLRMAYI